MRRESIGQIPAVGKCDCCGEYGQLYRTYFHYNIKCQCHSPNHFIVKDHCKMCVPVEPFEQKITFTTEQIKELEEMYEVSAN